MEESIMFAKKYLEDILSFFGLNTDVYATHDDDVIQLSVPSTHLNGFLIGQRGDTLRAIQFLVSTALKNNEHEYTRVNVDIADYKRHRYDRMAERAEKWVAEVQRNGKELPLDLRACLELAAAQYPDGVVAPGSTEQVFDYMIERFRAWYEDEAIPAEVFRAVSAKGISQPLDIQRRVHAVNAFARLPEAAALAAANKRVSNILAKLEAGHPFTKVNTDLLVEAQEIALSDMLVSVATKSGALFDRGAYTEALASLAVLRGPVDAFFDGVMVNTENDGLRNNRLNLLKALRDLFVQVADISQLVVSK